MNSHAEYRRHSYRSPETSYSPEPDHSDGDQLARHADPSLPQTQQPGATSKRVAWVRPTELPNFAGPLVGRGIDLQAELIRRARRTPKTATRAVRRHIHHQQPATSREEGIGL